MLLESGARTTVLIRERLEDWGDFGQRHQAGKEGPDAEQQARLSGEKRKKETDQAKRRGGKP